MQEVPCEGDDNPFRRVACSNCYRTINVSEEVRVAGTKHLCLYCRDKLMLQATCVFCKDVSAESFCCVSCRCKLADSSFCLSSRQDFTVVPSHLNARSNNLPAVPSGRVFTVMTNHLNSRSDYLSVGPCQEVTAITNQLRSSSLPVVPSGRVFTAMTNHLNSRTNNLSVVPSFGSVVSSAFITPSPTSQSTQKVEKGMQDQEMEEKYSYVEEDMELICAICLGYFEKPTIHVKCGNTFCYDCVSGLEKCPICRESVVSDLQEAPKLVRNMLDRLSVSCNTCQSVMTREQFKNNHQLSECVGYCKWGCGEQIRLCEQTLHDTVCEFLFVECTASNLGCDAQLLQKDLQKHLQVCPFVSLAPVLHTYREEIKQCHLVIETLKQELKELKGQ